MKKERLDTLSSLIYLWSVDTENGIVKTSGYIWIHKRQGRLMTAVHVNNKTHIFYVHEVIAYVGGLDLLDKTVNHKNGDKLDNRIDNLECISQEEQWEHQSLMDLYAKGSRHGNSKIAEEDVISIRSLYNTRKFTQKEIGEMFGISITAVSRIVNHKYWNHV